VEATHWLQRTIGNHAAVRLATANTRQGPEAAARVPAGAGHDLMSAPRDHHNARGHRQIQLKGAAGETPTVAPVIEAGLESARRSGAPLPDSVRSQMEPRFGADFSSVRVHTGHAAARLNEGLRSQAFTYEGDIYFAAGRYQPESFTGQRLLAHELSHVLQQAAAVRPGPFIAKHEEQCTGEFRNPRGRGLPSDLVQRQPNEESAESEDTVVDKVIDALNEPNPIAGAGNVDQAFSTLNNYTVPFLVRVLSKLYDRGYLYGLLGYLAPGTKANDSVVAAIRVTQCRKEPSGLALEDIREASLFLVRLYGASPPKEIGRMAACLDWEREKIEDRLAREHRDREIQQEREHPKTRRGRKRLTRGLMEWWLVPLKTYDEDDYEGQPSAKIQILFTPNKQDKNKQITFLQTVLQTTSSSSRAKNIPLLDIGRSDPFDPFYGADFSTRSKEWTPEGAPYGYENAPSSATNPRASLYDVPSVPPEQTKLFESVAVVPSTGEVLGALRWGVEWRSGGSLLVGAETKDCTDTASADYETAVKRFYATPATIDVSDRKPIGEQHYAAILDGFDADDAALTASHKKQLDEVAGQFKQFPKLSALLGGFADATEKDPSGISQGRAEKAKDYLIARGVQGAAIRTAGFGAAWARYPPSPTETRNRRVQILLKF
jgi:outer membrane protein OmpA-like peptidoglycan-associated protein